MKPVRQQERTVITDFLFPRSFNRDYPVAVRGKGVHLYDDSGRRYLDACGGAAVVTIGHGVGEIVRAIARQTQDLAYAHTSQFQTEAGAQLADYLRVRFPGRPQHVRTFFTSGGSEATETAIKIVRQYWLNKGQPGRHKIISRWQSYHGATLGALALSGNKGRRAPYSALLPSFAGDAEHISPCFCYHCPLNLTFPSCKVACARELEPAIERLGPKSVAAFICEPVVGATTGAPAAEGYLKEIRRICDKYQILLIADEIMTGAGRTGRFFAVEHDGVVPDLILLGKGLASGYAPLAAVLAAERVWRAIEKGSGTLEHGFTYQGHPPALAAGLAVQRYIQQNRLIEVAVERGAYLAARLEQLREIPVVGDVRGRGLLQSVEFVQDQASRAPLPPTIRFADQLAAELRRRSVLVYPMRGTADGFRGDHIMIAPPFIITKQQIHYLVDQIARASRAIM
jgi:adenosylmethionine-8-amino-7-oxononanoate aminotransferase